MALLPMSGTGRGPVVPGEDDVPAVRQLPRSLETDLPMVIGQMREVIAVRSYVCRISTGVGRDGG
ncbi:hypothetical protein EAD98_10100 [Micromonospora sp. CV4]|nr:hypothetical protein EAD98_10100 [Micromonospora sp. CV4]